MSQTPNGNVKNCYRKKKIKNNGTYNTFHGPTIPGMNRWEILISRSGMSF